MALRRPYTFVVMAVLIAILGGVAIATMPVDIFPYIDIPIVSIVWHIQRPVSGRDGKPHRHEFRARSDLECQRYRTYRIPVATRRRFGSRASTFTQTWQSIWRSRRSLTSCQVRCAIMPPGMFPPQILKYDAASVPDPAARAEQQELQEQEIFDLAQNFIRTRWRPFRAQRSLARLAARPADHGRPESQELYAKQLSPTDVSNALNLQNLILPAGTVKFAANRVSGSAEYQPASYRRIQRSCRSRR